MKKKLQAAAGPDPRACRRVRERGALAAGLAGLLRAGGDRRHRDRAQIGLDETVGRHPGVASERLHNLQLLGRRIYTIGTRSEPCRRRHRGVAAVIFFGTILNRSAVWFSIGGFVYRARIAGGADHVQKEDRDGEDYRDSKIAWRVWLVVPAHRSQAEHQQDGGARTREMKLAVIWTAGTTDEEGRIRADEMSASYNAAIESTSTGDCDRELSAFAQRVDREAARRGFHDVDRQVVIGDGARWIWSICDELFPRAIQIVDIWHAKELLRAGDIEALLDSISDHRTTDEEADRAYTYFSRNRDRMRYRAFRNDGLCVSSGMVEGGCKTTIGARLKRGGMHWTVRGTNRTAALRSSILSNRFEDYWYEKSASR